MSGLQVFERPQTGSGGRSRGVGPTISVGKPGLLSFNRPAAELFGSAESWFWVALLSDPDTGRIAVRAVGENDPSAWGKPRPRGGGSGGLLLNAKAFLDHIGAQPGQRWIAHREGDLIIGEPA